MTGIDNNFTKIAGQESLNSSQIKMANIYLMVSDIFTGKTKKFMENNKDELYVFESESDHSDEQKESNIANKDLLSNQTKNQMNNQTLQICLI